MPQVAVARHARAAWLHQFPREFFWKQFWVCFAVCRLAACAPRPPQVPVGRRARTLGSPIPPPAGRGIGGAKRDRTADLLHAMQALSQLSYGPVPMKDRPGGPILRLV